MVNPKHNQKHKYIKIPHGRDNMVKNWILIRLAQNPRPTSGSAPELWGRLRDSWSDSDPRCRLLVHLTSSPLEDPFFPSIPISLQLSVGLFLRKVCCDKANMNRTGINSLVLLCLWGPVNTYTCCFWHIMNELWQKQPAVNVKQMSFLCESKCMNISHSSQVSQHDHKLCHKHVNAMLKTFCTIGSWRLLQKSSSFWNANISIKEGRHAEKPSDCSNSGTQIFRFIPEMMLWITDFTQQSDEWAAALWPYVPLIGMKWSCENPERQRLFITQIHQICE